MRNLVIKTLVSIVALVTVVVLSLGMALSPEPATAEAPPQCIVQVQGTVGIVICADIPIAQIQLPTVTVQGPTITLPPVTLPPITVPGETVTLTLPPVGEPGGTETVTVNIPNETVTVTEQASEGPNTSQPSSLPTVTETATGQNPPGDGTIEDNDMGDPIISIGDGKTTVVEAALGLLATVLLVGLMILTLWAGYILGYKDKEKKDTSFMRALLDQAKIGRGQHR